MNLIRLVAVQPILINVVLPSSVNCPLQAPMPHCDNNTSSQIISGLSRVIALDVHYSLGYIFWTDVSDLNIKRSCIDGTNVTIIHSTTGTCDGLAVEWMRYQLYWTDTTDDVIRVSDLEGKNTRILISLGLDEPRGIALDPERG